MEEHYKAVKEKYDRFQQHLLSKGQLLAKSTAVGFWGVTPLPEAFEAFKLINLGSYSSFLDLGSGDGRMVLLASLFGVKSVGIEMDNDLLYQSIHIKNSLALPHFSNAKFLHDNFLDHDMTGYNLVYSSPDKPFHRKGLELKLLRELKGDLLVHGWEFHPQQLKKKEEHVINGEKFCLYSRH